jgi:uncharacterized protein
VVPGTDSSPREVTAKHPKLVKALERLSSADLGSACATPAPPELIKAMHEFNTGEFFEQHETLEDAWIAETDPIRYLYQGILQVGVGLYHLERGNLQGARGMMGKGIVQLEPFRPRCLGVDIERFVAQARRCLQSVETLTDETLATFDRSLMPRVEFDG